MVHWGRFKVGQIAVREKGKTVTFSPKGTKIQINKIHLTHSPNKLLGLFHLKSLGGEDKIRGREFISVGKNLLAGGGGGGSKTFYESWGRGSNPI